MDSKDITNAVFEALNKHKAVEIEHLKSEILQRDKRIDELEIELNRYKQACIELDGQLSDKDNDIGDMKLEKHALIETIDTIDIEKRQILTDLELARKGIQPEQEKQTLFTKLKNLFMP
jgi:chromosome segregation ATPase